MQRYVIGFLIELLMWFGLVAIFLWAYVTHYAGSVDAVLPHAALSMTVWVGLVSLRLAFHRIFPAERVARMASVALMTCAFAVTVRESPFYRITAMSTILACIAMRSKEWDRWRKYSGRRTR
ncbi:MAG: hypothetical protein OZ935_18605, partial [Pseudomonadota bacterium]|nr:hypothetical protein [Pseudomonadota bacterium]